MSDIVLGVDQLTRILSDHLGIEPSEIHGIEIPVTCGHDWLVREGNLSSI